jgi:predicted GIY-YIG superfamily endonuclease
MQFVYLLECIDKPECKYVGMTWDLNRDLIRHNAKKVPETSISHSWKIITSMRFSDHKVAERFRNYLLTPAGKAYSNKFFFEKKELRARYLN